jgi:hypothetical protein
MTEVPGMRMKITTLFHTFLLMGLFLGSSSAEAAMPAPEDQLPPSTYFVDEEPPSGPYDPVLEETEEPEEEFTEVQEVEPAVVRVMEEPKPKPVAKKKKPRIQRPFSVTGSQPLDLEDTALRVDLGYPELVVAYHMPFNRKLEFVPAFGLFYQTAGADTGLLARCEIKYAFFKDKEHGLALIADPGIMVPLDPDKALGLIFGGPGVLYDYTIAGEHHLTAGIQIPWGLFIGDGFAARIPAILRMGAEFSVANDLNFFFQMSGGADVWTDSYGSKESKDLEVDPYLKMTLGVAIRM